MKRRPFYRLTDMVLALFPAVVFTIDWGYRWLTAQLRRFRIIHEPCGAVFHPAFACSHCRGLLRWPELRLPGQPPRKFND
jgi:hypothetical protein